MLEENWLKYPCLLADFGDGDAMRNVPSSDDTSLVATLTTKPASKDGMSSPLPWCLDRVGAVVPNGQGVKATVEKLGNSTPVLAQLGVYYIMSNNGHESLPILVIAHTKINQEPSQSSPIPLPMSMKSILASGIVNEPVPALHLKQPPPSAASSVSSHSLPKPPSMSIT